MSGSSLQREFRSFVVSDFEGTISSKISKKEEETFSIASGWLREFKEEVPTFLFLEALLVSVSFRGG
ncbi:hypothetical protein LEP1GSC150_5079 [Leptospira interrogans serovar Copenhageni str. LT2050]|uniref:Uncharacterized protein n=1 Tax=Leptospira interrogans serovar Copenhageni str. LT2050 TaxID=1001598 RepID=M3IMS8_LEPIT|nr:hypothetical protein LEP1GSC150_5079 [Leptospira interrogans serovar Copenhageni str. LT2050]OBZ98123.1 Uncharacterized protein A9P81_3927 [Leptospira interrogans serovar Copenhageni/Icterohaemorrhagiae]